MRARRASRESAPPADPARALLRGSRALVAGRLLSLALHFASQLLIVRHLARDDYGAFAYALAATALLEAAISLGLPSGLSRALPAWQERGERARMLAGIAAAALVAFGAGAALAIAGSLAPEALRVVCGGDANTARLLAIALWVIPIESLERLAIGVFASFSAAGAIFVRRHLLAPALRLLLVAACIAADGTAAFLAFGYVGATGLGLALNAGMLARVLRREVGALHAREVAVALRAGALRELLAVSLPLFATELLALAAQSLPTLVLGQLRTPDDVASLRAILPIANLNTLVMSSAALLFTPAFTRLIAQGDLAAARSLYARSARWLALLSLPIFALTSLAASPVTLLLFGERYASSGPLLRVLAIAMFLNAALGFNQLTLVLLGHSRRALAIAVAALALELGVALALVPAHGAFGAALASAAGLVAQNVLSQAALARTSEIPFFAFATSLEWRPTARRPRPRADRAEASNDLETSSDVDPGPARRPTDACAPRGNSLDPTRV
jgi:O-antigen/teichoic acid export membrane protein